MKEELEEKKMEGGEVGGGGGDGEKEKRRIAYDLIDVTSTTVRDDFI